MVLVVVGVVVVDVVVGPWVVVVDVVVGPWVVVVDVVVGVFFTQRFLPSGPVCLHTFPRQHLP